MAKAAGPVVLPPHTTLSPRPLHISKKPRRASFRRRILRKFQHREISGDSAQGPLDDIIDEITCNIWQSPPDYTLESSLRDWVNPPNPLKALPTWTVTPLPISRIPSREPLTIRKNRNSRSTASGSSMGDTKLPSRDSSKGDDNVGTLSSTTCTPWPLFDPILPYADADFDFEYATSTNYINHPSAQQALKKVIDSDGKLSKTRRPSILQKVSDGWTRLRRTGTSDTSRSSTSSNTPRPTTLTLLAPEDTEGDVASGKEPVFEDAADMRKNHNSLDEPDLCGRRLSERNVPPPTLQAAVRILSEVNLLTAQDSQEFWVCVEVEGVLESYQQLPDTAIDVVFVVDTSYYVTKECLTHAVNSMMGVISCLTRGDRIALYATHCNHEPVTGTVPDMLYPLRPICGDTEAILRDLATYIVQYGTQAWQPARPNPSMADVVIAVSKTVANEEPKHSRAHVIVLSPVANDLHKACTSQPRLQYHQVNPAAVPFRITMEQSGSRNQLFRGGNNSRSNYTHYRSTPGRLKQIIHDARLEKPLGELAKVTVDISPKAGCKVVAVDGPTHIASLRLGQLHTFFVKLRIERSQIEELDLHTTDPILLDALEGGLRQELAHVAELDATKAHVLSIRATSRNALRPHRHWQFTEQQLLMTAQQGKLATPHDLAAAVARRRLFHRVTNRAPPLATAELDAFEGADKVASLAEAMAKEVGHHEAVLKYEETRKGLPVCVGPVCVAPAHEWLVERWDEKKMRRRGLVM
ncbi:hypothetical protein BDV95DRAFT_604790 [Massariosphaeria phaeospora]|uniref:VWFA domain-containing protein n=1 Tax=Massariosphaeria phaeospora TaxID=100035 RepID=A0A7C8IAJ9_9PLEO|nr:hypothetical protein BDV95DRAFT_604790 [Massariosphaeria phaeospora]